MSHASPWLPGDRPSTPDATRFRFIPCTGPLSHFVEYYYTAEVERRFIAEIEAARLPEVEAKLVFAIEEGNDLPGGIALGGGLRACLFVQPAHLQVIAIPGSIRQAVGASLRPNGLRLILPQGAQGLVDAPLVALDELWGAEARELRDRLALETTASARLALMEQYLLSRVEQLDRPSRAAQRAFELIELAHGEISTEQLAHACGFSSRTLRSTTVAEAGLTPKQLARIVRIRYALNLLTGAGVPLSAAAASSAFADHAHMSREFRELLGEPPSRLGLKIRSTKLPAFSAERNLFDTGLLVLSKSSGP